MTIQQPPAPSTPAPKRVIAYVDGFNLYYTTIKPSKIAGIKWLDIKALCASFLKENEELVGVKYFSALLSTKSKNDRDKGENERRRQAAKARQEVYWGALQGSGVRIYQGSFSEKPVKALEKSVKYLKKQINALIEQGHLSDEEVNALEKQMENMPRYTWEEKKTDVNLAIEMVLDGAYNNYDTALLVSADADFIPATKKVRAMNKKIPAMRKKVIILRPVEKKTQDATEQENMQKGGIIELSPSDCKKHLLPATVRYEDKPYTIPKKWKKGLK